jgi:hypothetical protein
MLFYVADVDALYERALAAGCQPTTAPRDAELGERFFHLIGGPYPFKKSNEFRKLRTRDLAEGRRHAAPNPTHWPASFGLKRARPI